MNRLIKSALRPTANLARRVISNSVNFDLDRTAQQVQRTIVNQYLSFKMNGVAPYSDIRDAGFRAYSEFEEDGIILYVLSMIGFKTRRVAEIGCGDGSECMATNLIINHGFDGFLFDGSAENICGAHTFFSKKRDCHLYPPVLTHAWITAENVNDLLITAGCKGEFDLFSLDLDGNDYWILNAINAIQPRLLIVETHDIIPSDKSLTIQYDPKFFCWNKAGHEQDYRGASLLAMQRLCRRQGYRMIGAHRHGFNVLFLKEGEGEQFFPEVSIEQIHDNHWTRWGQTHRWPLVKDMPWKEVEF